MTGGRARRVVLAVAWTVALAFGLRQLDRTLTAAPPTARWQAAGDLAEIPTEAGQLALPSYLPGHLQWPPRTLRYRLGPRPGWWLGVHAIGGAAPVLWIGTGDEPLPPAIADEPRCVHSTPHARCDGDWRALSRQLADGQVVFVLTSLRPIEAARLLKGLQPEEPTTRHRTSRHSLRAN